MAALPPPLESSRQRSRAAGTGTMVLGVVVAVGAALLFIVVMGADKGDSARAGAVVPRGCDHLRIRLVYRSR